MAKLLTVVETSAYLSKAERLMSEEERCDIVDLISREPQSGVLVPGTGGLRKLRIGLEGRGKRGGGRVIYWFHSDKFPAVLLWVFAKNEASDLTSEQKRAVMAVAAALPGEFGARK